MDNKMLANSTIIMKKKLLVRFTLIGLSLGLIIGLIGGITFLVSEILYGDYPDIAYVLGQSGLVICIVVAITNLSVQLVKSYKEYW
jgi:hypothetical protein